MYIWDYDRQTLTKDDAGERWALEREVTYGLGGKKMNAERLRRHLPYLDIPDDHRYFLTLILQ